MKSIGELFKQQRLKKKLSLVKLEQKTKIKKEFISAIENQDWKMLPDFSTILGFVKTLADRLGIREERAVSLFKRDYPPQEVVNPNPKPAVSDKFTWSPKITFWLTFTAVFLMIFSYLVVQYRKFVSPPLLEVTKPKQNQMIFERKVFVEGKTDGESVITVNNQPVLTTSEGDFQTEIIVTEETTEILVKAVSRSGKETVIYRNIKSEFN